jgi:hypothetical protein
MSSRFLHHNNLYTWWWSVRPKHVMTIKRTWQENINRRYTQTAKKRNAKTDLRSATGCCNVISLTFLRRETNLQRRSWEAVRQFPLRNPKFHYHVHNSLLKSEGLRNISKEALLQGGLLAPPPPMLNDCPCRLSATAFGLRDPFAADLNGQTGDSHYHPIS